MGVSSLDLAALKQGGHFSPGAPMLGTILLCFAFVFAVFAAAGRPTFGSVNMGWLAFTFFVAAQLFGSIIRLF